MNINPERIRQHLQDFNFPILFAEELGWQAPRGTKIGLPASFATDFGAAEVAHLGGIPAIKIVCKSTFPDASTRRQIHDAIARQFHENLLIFVDQNNTRMLWFWVKRQDGKTLVREHPFVKGQPGDLFLTKLVGLFVDFEEYDDSGNFSVLSAAQKLKNALDVSKVTKKFYGEFSNVHLQLVELLGGIPSETEKKWYASVLLNRLMFTYFLQKKGFLDNGDYEYLEHRFAQFNGGNIFADFLQPLFFKAFALPDTHADKIAAKSTFGRIPYLNGGLFLPHKIEVDYHITLPNEGAHNILELFNSVTWYLNDVPGEDDNAMSPDVLGYIFEKYINDQKSAGAYYTPPEITEYLCERTIEDLLVERVSVNRNGAFQKYQSLGELLLDLDRDSCRVVLERLKELRLCDPAVGSGAFLVAALKTLTGIYGALWGRAEVLGDEELKYQLIGDQAKHKSPFYAIRKRIITRNLYGVDLMAEATEIARLRLFLALVASAKTVDELEPLPNIEFNILPGNSLIGMLHCEEEDFIGGGMFVKTQFDELTKKKDHFVRLYKSTSSNGLGDLQEFKSQANQLRGELNEICNDAVLREFANLKINIDVINRHSREGGNPVRGNDGTKKSKRAVAAADIENLHPFHWGSDFDEVIKSGGFDAIITNPPWEIWKPNAKEFFQQFSDAVTKKKMTIKEFEKQQKVLLKQPEIAAAWQEYQAGFPHVSEYFRKCPDYKNQISIVNGKKAGTDINLYKLFTERCYDLLKDGGRCGIVIPSGIYTDLGAKQLREMLFGHTAITGLFCFENRKEIFEGVHRSFKFVALSFCKGKSTFTFPAAFMRHDVSELEDFPSGESLQISVDLIKKLSPDSLSVMEFKSERDIDIAEKMLKFPLLGETMEGVWNLSLTREFDMTNDSHLFQTEPGKGRLPLYEGKMIHQFQHDLAEPRYWVDEKEGRKNLLGRTEDGGQKLDYQMARLAFRSIARNTDKRTIIVGAIPPNSFCGNSLLPNKTPDDAKGLNPQEVLFAQAVLNSFTLDWYLRLIVTANINMFYLYQLPVPRLTTGQKYFSEIVTRAAQLICTSPEFDDLSKAAGLTSHRDGATDPATRSRLRAELDGMVAHLYGLNEDDFAHILGTFPLVDEPVKQAARNAFRDIERGVLY